MRILYISFAIILIDQISKLLVKGFSVSLLNIHHTGMSPGQKINFIGDWFNFTFVENSGIAFGVDFGGDYKLLITLFVITATIALFLFLFIIRNKDNNLKIPVAFILGGAVGNLIDRVFYGVFYGYAPLFHGKVVDFIDFRILNLLGVSSVSGNYIFNLADFAVTIGVVLLIVVMIKQNTEEPEADLANLNSENKD